jgi:nucleoid-associated protein YgaU
VGSKPLRLWAGLWLFAAAGSGAVVAQAPAQRTGGDAVVTVSPVEPAAASVEDLIARLDRLTQELATTQEELQRRGMERPAEGTARPDTDTLQALRLLRADYAAQGARLRAAQNAAQQAQRSHEQASATIVDLRRSLTALERENAELRNAAGGAGVQRLQSLNEELAQTRQALEAALATAQEAAQREGERRSTDVQRETELAARVQELEQQLRVAQERVRELERAEQELQAALAQRPSSPEQVAPPTVPVVSNWEEREASLTAQLEDRERAVRALNAQLAERDRALQAERQRLTTLLTENRQLAIERERLEEQVYALQNQPAPPVADPAPFPSLVRVGDDPPPAAPQPVETSPTAVVSAPAAAAPSGGDEVAAPARSPERVVPTFSPFTGTTAAAPTAPAPDESARIRRSPTRPEEAQRLLGISLPPVALAPAPPPASVAAPTLPAPAVPPPPAPEHRHVVRPGDSLTAISVRYYGTSRRWEDIFEANRDILSDPNLLQVGQRLRIPGA